MYFLLLLLLIPLIFHVVTRYSRRRRYLEKIPGPKPLPILGNILMFRVPCLNKFWEVARRVNKQYYPICKYTSFVDGVVNVYHPDDLEILLSSQKIIQKGFFYNHMHSWLNFGLLTSTGEKWRQRRKLLTPAFHFDVLKKYIEVADEEGVKFVERLKSRGQENTYDLMKLCSDYTLNVICETAMGVKLDSMDVREVEKYKKAIHDMGNSVVYRITRPYITNWTMPIFFYKFYKWHKNVIHTLKTFSKRIIQERVEYHRQNDNKYLDDLNDNMNDDDDDGSNDNANRIIYKNKRRLAMLDLLLLAKKEGLIDDEGIQEEVDTFTFEGHDTTGMATTYVLMLLAEHKEAQERARAEVKSALEASGGNTSKKDFLANLNYLGRCIKESLRLYPPVSTVMRYATEDIQLKNAFVPKGAHIFIHFWDTHRDPNFWTDPDLFQPDRFLPENSVNRHPFSYVPFSAGPRNCIGQKFAMMEMKHLLARLLYDFRLEPVDRLQDMKLMADIILRPLKPIHVKFIRIDK